MKKSITESQFVEAVYRHYRGESLSEIAKAYGIGQSTLTEIRKRRIVDWERVRHRIIDAEIASLRNQEQNMPDSETRETFIILLKYMLKYTTYHEILPKFCEEINCTPDEARTYICAFESHLPLKIPR